VYLYEEDIVCFPGIGYNVYFCEENIVYLSEMRIWFVYLRKRNSFLI
jgi:hypothetical protein